MQPEGGNIKDGMEPKCQHMLHPTQISFQRVFSHYSPAQGRSDQELHVRTHKFNKNPFGYVKSVESEKING